MSAKSGVNPVVLKQAGPDGIVDLDYETEFLDVFRAEKFRFQIRNREVGGYDNMPFQKFIREEAYSRADSFFYGEEYGGGRLYRIHGAPGGLGAGPYRGGNLNYINQGLIFSARGDSAFTAMTVVLAWNRAAGATGNTDSQYLHQRLRLTGFGHDSWRRLP